MADQSISSSASFHERPFHYSEGKNVMFYQNIKMVGLLFIMIFLFIYPAPGSFE